MADSSDFFLFSMSNVLENNEGDKTENHQNNTDSTETSSHTEKNTLFRESHTPTELETDDSRITTPRENNLNNKSAQPKKANTKEVVFLEEEKDNSSNSDSNSDQEKKDSESDANASTDPEVIQLDQLSPIMEKEEIHHSEEEIQLSPEIDDYDLEDAERYFTRQNGSIVCRLCGKTGHKSRDCPEYASNNACFLCGELNHTARNCPHLICRHCHKPGHNSASCPEKRVPGFCQYCSSRLHKSDDCPIIPHACDKSIFKQVHCVCCGKLGHLLCKGQPTLQGSRGGKCAICGSRDHYYLQCGDRNSHRTIHSGESEARQGACFICGKYGHFAAECPEKRRQDNPPVFAMKRKSSNKRQNSHSGGYAKRFRE